MAVMADIMIDEEICLNFAIKEDCLIVPQLIHDADVIDCKEFFEEFLSFSNWF